MEILGKKILLNETMLDNTGEKTLEGEIIVPDYCPDVMKIVKTEAIPRILSKRKSQDKLIIEGIVEIRIFYWPEKEKGVRCVNYTSNFSQEYEVKDIDNSVHIRAAAKTEYVHSNIINSRKISYKTVVSFAAKTYYKRDFSILLAEQTYNMETLTDKIEVSNIAAAGEKNITISDIIEISETKGEIKEILKCEAVLMTVDLKCINNKIITRGKAEIKILYLSVDEKLETIFAEIPFTQIIDLDGIDEDCITDLKYIINNFTCNCRENENGQNRQVCVDIDSTVHVRGYKNCSYNIAKDIYSTAYPCKCDRKQMSIEKLNTQFSGGFSGKDFLESTECIKNIADISAIPTIAKVTRDSDSLRLLCYVNCSIIAINENASPFAIVKQCESELKIPIDESLDSVRIEPDVKVSSISYTIANDNRVEIKYEISLDSLVFANYNVDIVTAINLDETNKLERENISPMVIYYGKSGDRIWDIAKEYKTSSRAIREANSIDKDVLAENKTIIIPIMKA